VGRLAAPLIVANATVPLLGIVDTAVVGQLDSPTHLGGVAVGSLLFGYVFWSFGFLRGGTSGPMAQALGARDGDEMRAVLARAGLIVAVAGVGLIAILLPLLASLLRLAGASTGVEGHAVDYAGIRLLSAPATLAGYALLGALTGLQRPRGALALMLATNGTNIVLDLWFVLDLGWGVRGVAAASVIAEYIGAAVGLVALRRALTGVSGAWRRRQILDRGALRRMAGLNRDILLRNLALISAFSLFTVFGARLDDVTLAANAVLMNFHTLAGYVLDGFADAAEALVGQAVGRRARDQFRAAVRAAALWVGGFAVVLVTLLLVLGGVFIDIMTVLPEVRAAARDYMPYVAIAPLIGAWAFLLDGVFMGATRGPEMRNAMMLALIAFIAAASALVPWLGNHGLWSAYVLFMIARVALLGRYLPRLARGVG